MVKDENQLLRDKNIVKNLQKIITICNILAMLGVICMVGPAAYYGGSIGDIRNGRYYLVEHDKETEVTKGVYDFVEMTSSLIWVSVILLPTTLILTAWKNKINSMTGEYKRERRED